MGTEISSRLAALRAEMASLGIDAYIIPGTDPHQSEYYAEHWDFRTWISGFDGSAGTVVVTLQEAGLWTDSRYFLQADEQLAESGIKLFKEGLPDTPSYTECLTTVLPGQATVALDEEPFPVTAVATMQRVFASQGLHLTNASTP